MSVSRNTDYWADDTIRRLIVHQQRYRPSDRDDTIRRLIVHQQRYRPSDSNENVDIKFSVNNLNHVPSKSKD